MNKPILGIVVMAIVVFTVSLGNFALKAIFRLNPLGISKSFLIMEV